MKYAINPTQQTAVKTIPLAHNMRIKRMYEQPEDVTCESCKYSTPYTVDGGTCGKFKAWFCLFEPMEEGYNDLEQIEPTDKPCEAYAVL